MISSEGRLRVVLSMLALAVVSLSGAGCQAQSSASPDSTPQRDWSSLPDYEDPCVRDSGCGEILRCLDGTCQIPPAITGDATESTPVVVFREASSNGIEADSSDVDVDAVGTSGSEVARFYVEVADTRAERSRGLMHRRKMADGWGMLFVYPDEAERAFWMKNTLIPLDIIFISGGGRIVSIVHEAAPQTLERRRSDVPARYAVEVKGGVAESAGIEVGQMVEFEHVATRHRPSR